MGVEVYIRPDYCQLIYFKIFDVCVGLIEYMELTDYVYIGGNDLGYSYEDLDINNPHPDIAKLIRKKHIE
jgi:hypothetical protein